MTDLRGKQVVGKEGESKAMDLLDTRNETLRLDVRHRAIMMKKLQECGYELAMERITETFRRVGITLTHLEEFLTPEVWEKL